MLSGLNADRDNGERHAPEVFDGLYVSRLPTDRLMTLLSLKDFIGNMDHLDNDKGSRHTVCLSASRDADEWEEEALDENELFNYF